jgi:N6-adenosine-specific RNA methylase IME4
MTTAIARRDPVLMRLEHARTQLAQANDLQQVKRIADAASAAKIYARQQKLGGEAIAFANSVKLEAMRRLGELYQETPKNRGARGTKWAGKTRRGTKRVPRLDEPPTLRELGLTKKESAIAKTLAELSIAQFAPVREGERSIHDVQKTKRRAARVTRINATIAHNAPLVAAGDQPVPVIYADPPWQYEHVKTDNRAIENHYPTMTLEAICALPVATIATPDAVLFLWATSPKLAEALRVVEAWGFTYRTCMAWIKPSIGMGYYVRQQHELLLIASRGDLPVPEPARRPPSVLAADRGAHSAKPDEFYMVIERMYPEYPKRELFARATRDGWQQWGNQAGARKASA